ncbi:MAG: TlpA disulfide reductase family protein, partial [Chitinophagaceae bacterium]
RLPMTRKGSNWEAAFKLARYATYATFTIESGNKVQKAAPDKHYAVPVYENGQRIFSSYLYESYSLGAQMGKDPRVPVMQAALLDKELAIHPDNYEAKVRLLFNKMNGSSGKEKEKYRKQALDVMAANFYSNPGNMGLMNKTTMGYLIIGEKTRLDSIRSVVRKKYPNTEYGYELQTDEIRSIADTEKKRLAAEALLQKTPAKDAKYINDLHELLLTIYAQKKDEKKALYHLRQIDQDTSPYRGEAYLRRANTLLQNDILLDSAVALTERAYSIAADFPAGVIRFFPETGYILPYVDPAVKMQVEQAAKANSLSLEALVKLKKGAKEEAGKLLAEAVDISTDAKTLSNAGIFFREINNPEKAFKVTKKLVMEKQEDTAAQRMMKEDYFAWKKSGEGWDRQMTEVTDYWRTRLLVILKKERMNKKSPGIERLVTLKGEAVTPSAMEGKIVVIDFWATWCLPCMKEMPYVEAVYKKYKDNPRVMFMIVNSGSGNTLEDARGWSGNQTYSFPVYYTNDKSLGEKFGFSVIPTTLIIDGKGVIQFRNIGFEGPVIEHKIGTAIDLLLSEKS